MTQKTALYNEYSKHTGKIVNFAGFLMPISFVSGIVKEHHWVRKNCGVFDVSHMGQLYISGTDAAKFLMHITPASFTQIANHTARYTVLTTENGTIIDDLIITKLSADKFFIVINAGCIEKDINWFANQAVNFDVTIERLDKHSLIAIQGPKAAAILTDLIDNSLNDLSYMTANIISTSQYGKIIVSRTGYTGEDGFEISLKNHFAVSLWQDLLKNSAVQPIGLGARDSLRLEMGYPLYGHDITEQTSVIEAGLSWVISNDNKEYIGANKIAEAKQQGIRRKRVGIKLIDKGIARENMALLNLAGEKIGMLTSAGYSPTLDSSIGQGYVTIDYAKKDTEILVDIRGNHKKAIVSSPIFLKKS